MSIRTKLLVLLLLIAVSPLVVVAIFDLITARELGQTLAEERRQLLLKDTDDLMRSIVEGYVRVLQRDRIILEHAIEIQAREVEARLAKTEPEPRRVYFEADYESPATWPAGTELSSIHLRMNPDGTSEPIAVNYDQQVFFLVQGVHQRDVQQQIDQLASMTDAYRFLYETDPELMVWQYTALANGVFTSYPGHAGYPEDFDPRQRPWYLEAKQADQTAWKILPDISTRNVTLMIAQPVHWPDGSFAGATGIDIPMDGLFAQINLPEHWSRDAEVMLVGQGEPTTGAVVDAVILAQQGRHATTSARDWRKPIQVEPLTSDPPEPIIQMMREAELGRPGVTRAVVDGEPVILAHGAGIVFPVIMLPESVIQADVESAREHIIAHVRLRQIVVLSVLLVIIAGVAIVAMRASRVVTRPAMELASAAEHLADGDFGAHVEVKGDDELAQLGRVFNQVGPQLDERQRIKQALQVAMDVQQNLLPSTTPKRDGLDVAGHSTYCDETGGDYYDYLDIIDLHDKSLAIVVGDVMGHGVAAAMLMATARGILRSRCKAPGSLAELLNHLNGLLVEDTRGTRFMTMLLMVVDAQTRTLRWASAGHDLPFIITPNGDGPIKLAGNGVPLGILSGEVFEEYTHADLSPGTLLFAATDGVWEMLNPAQEMFGKPRVCELLARCRGMTAGQISRALRDELTRFRGSRDQDDDVTFVVTKLT